MQRGGIDWVRVLERLCFLFPAVIGIGAIGLIEDLDPGIPGLQFGLVVIGSVGYSILTAGVTVALYLDVRQLRSRGPWWPSPMVSAASGFLWAPAAGVAHLYRRHRRYPRTGAWSGWWVLIAVSLLTTVLGVIGASVGVLLAMPGLILTASGIAGTVAFGTFPIAIHQDATHLAGQPTDWRPNPGGVLGLAFLSLFIPVLQALLAAYYLLRRHRAVGLEVPGTDS